MRSCNYMCVEYNYSNMIFLCNARIFFSLFCRCALVIYAAHYEEKSQGSMRVALNLVVEAIVYNPHIIT